MDHMLRSFLPLLLMITCVAEARPLAVDTGAAYTEGGVSFQELAVTSLEFRGARWQHLVTVAWSEPLAVKRHALVIVSNGDADELAGSSKKPRLPAAERKRLGHLALVARMPVAMLRQIPNQPILGGRSEDEAISHTLVQYFQTGDSSWPLLQPMVAAVSSGLDAVDDFAAARLGTRLNGFTLSGESKRGWTTWLAAAHDARIKALAPAVFDILSMRAQLAHQLASWGSYSEQIGDYSEQGLPKMLDTPAGSKLLKIIDPIEHATKLTQPKLLILATNDRYWPLDALDLYWDKLRGPKYVFYAAQQGHDLLDKGKIDDGLVALARAAAGKAKLPRVSFAASNGPSWSITSDTRPKEALVWRAAAKSRDFRSAIWRSSVVKSPGKALRVGLTPEESGLTASFVELRFDVAGAPLHVTTTVAITDAAGKLQE
jgi:PhoPQ-activated pathogenicity-related protein